MPLYTNSMLFIASSLFFSFFHFHFFLGFFVLLLIFFLLGFATVVLTFHCKYVSYMCDAGRAPCYVKFDGREVL